MRIISRLLALLLFSGKSVEPDPRQYQDKKPRLNKSLSHAGKLTILLLLPFAMQAQTAQVPALPVPIPALVCPTPEVDDPGWAITFVVPPNGKTVKLAMPKRVLLAAGQTKTVAASTTTQETPAPVTLAGAQYTMVINVPAGSETITNPDKSTTITGVTVTLTPVVK